MFSLRQIEIFRAVMIAKTVSGAAEMLNSSQPGLSRAIKHMEDRLGLELFSRARGRLAPTQEALRLFEEVKRIYKDIEQLEQITLQLRTGGDRIFKLGAPPSVGHGFVPELLRMLRDRYPDLQVQFDILAVDQVIDYLAFQGGELALTVYEVDHPNIDSELIGTGEMLCAVHAGSPLAQQSPITLAALTGETLISFPPDTAHGQIVKDMIDQSGAALSVGMRVRFAETAIAFVQKGLGVAIVDEFTARRPAEDVVLLPVRETGRLPVYLNRNRLTARSAVMADFEYLARAYFARPDLAAGATPPRRRRRAE